jgi:hypothetical protein
MNTEKRSWEIKLDDFLSNRNFQDAEDIIIDFLSNCEFSKCKTGKYVTKYLKKIKSKDKKQIIIFKPIVAQNRKEKKEVSLFSYILSVYPIDITMAKPQNEDDPYSIMKLRDLFGSFSEEDTKYESIIDSLIRKYN